MPAPKEAPDLDVVARTLYALSAELEKERRLRQRAERGWRLAEAELERLTVWIASKLPSPAPSPSPSSPE